MSRTAAQHFIILGEVENNQAGIIEIRTLLET